MKNHIGLRKLLEWYADKDRILNPDQRAILKSRLKTHSKEMTEESKQYWRAINSPDSYSKMNRGPEIPNFVSHTALCGHLITVDLSRFKVIPFQTKRYCKVCLKECYVNKPI